MKTSSSVALMAALSLLSVSSAFAAGMSRMQEPKNGFVQGLNPEWSTAHTLSKQSDPTHRLYHRNAEGGAPAQRNSQRFFLRQRNMLHRQWHLDASDALSVEADLDGGILRVFYSTVEVTIVEPSDQGTSSRTFIGVTPSRRSIVEAAEQRNRMHSALIGHQ